MTDCSECDGRGCYECRYPVRLTDSPTIQRAMEQAYASDIEPFEDD